MKGLGKSEEAHRPKNGGGEGPVKPVRMAELPLSWDEMR